MNMTGSEEYIDLVKSHFDFLVKDLGFEFTNQTEIGDNISMEYRSSTIYFRVIKAAPDFEPYFVLGRIGVDDLPHANSFFDNDVFYLDCCRIFRQKVQDEGAWLAPVERLARLLKECGMRCLNGDATIFAEMEKRNRKLVQEQLKEQRYLRFHRRAEEAWVKKDYAAAASNYAEIKDRLTDVELKRLSYAEKRTTN